MRIVATTKRLRDCRLWLGGMEELEFRYGGLSVESVSKKVDQLRASDDRTDAETEYMEAMAECLE